MSHRPIILLVDDNPNNLLALRTLLKVVDADLHEARNGFDALSMSIEEDYALILLDVQMPEMDGYEVCEQLRADPRTADTPVIFLTAAYKEDVDKLRGYVSGATDYLAKPIDDHILRSKVRVFLKLYAQSQLLKESEARIRAILDTALDAVVGMDQSGRITQWNLRAETLFGWSEREVLGRMLDEFIVPTQHREAHRHGLTRFLATREARVLNRRVEITAMRRAGDEFPIELAITPFRVDNTYSFTAFIADITLRKAAEDRIGFLANHDRLTELPNRELFFDRLSQSISQARRKRQRIAVLFLDLDGFKAVNDTHGHDVGDSTLKTVARRLRNCLREMDFVARIGGDEFLLLLGDIQSAADTVIVAEKVIAEISRPMTLRDGCQYGVGVSIGIALYPENGTEMDTLVQAADSAMYQSKSRGRNIYTISGEYSGAAATDRCWIALAGTHRVGIRVIDEQLEAIAAMLNRLNVALKRFDSRETIVRQLDEIIAFSHFHFETEDLLMKEHGYPDEEEHASAHRHLINEVGYLKEKFDQGGELLVLQWLKDWFLAHILSADKMLAEYLRGKGVN